MSGYDNVHAVLEMDVAEHAGNSVETIEKYINENRFENCMSPLHHQSQQDRPFHFPPGHKVLIRKFVQNIKEQITKKRKIIQHVSKCVKKPKVRKPDMPDDELLSDQEEEECIPSVKSEIRTKINVWVKNTLKKSIKENEHFTILATKELDTQNLSVHVRCGCGKSFALQRKKTGRKPWLISNWTKHVKTSTCKCSQPQDGGKQENLKTYFSTAVKTQNKKTEIPGSSQQGLSFYTPFMPNQPALNFRYRPYQPYMEQPPTGIDQCYSMPNSLQYGPDPYQFHSAFSTGSTGFQSSRLADPCHTDLSFELDSDSDNDQQTINLESPPIEDNHNIHQPTSLEPNPHQESPPIGDNHNNPHQESPPIGYNHNNPHQKSPDNPNQPTSSEPNPQSNPNDSKIHHKSPPSDHINHLIGDNNSIDLLSNPSASKQDFH